MNMNKKESKKFLAKGLLYCKLNISFAIVLLILQFIGLFFFDRDFVTTIITILITLSYLISSLNSYEYKKVINRYEFQILGLQKEKEDMLDDISKLEIKNKENILDIKNKLHNKTKFIDDFINLAFIDKKVPFYIMKALLNVSYSKYDKINLVIDNNKEEYTKEDLSKNKKLTIFSKMYEYALIYITLIEFNNTSIMNIEDGELYIAINNNKISNAMYKFKDNCVNIDPDGFKKYYDDLLKLDSEIKNIKQLQISLQKE